MLDFVFVHLLYRNAANELFNLLQGNDANDASSIRTPEVWIPLCEDESIQVKLNLKSNVVYKDNYVA